MQTPAITVQALGSGFSTKSHALLCREYIKGRDWYIRAMHRRIEEIDWKAARNDVSRFVGPGEQESIRLWSSELFLYQLDRLSDRWAELEEKQDLS